MTSRVRSSVISGYFRTELLQILSGDALEAISEENWLHTDAGRDNI